MLCNEMKEYTPVTGLDVKVTNKCMLECDFCANSDGNNNSAFLDPDRLKAALIEIVNAPRDLAKLNSVYFTGGETLYGIDYIDSVLSVIPKEVFTSVVTNGLMLNDKVIDELMELNLNRIKVSYDTTSPDLLGQIRNGMKHNGLLLLERNIRRSVESNFLVYLRVALTSKNIDDLDNIYKKAEDLGVNTLQIKPVIHSGRATGNEKLILSRSKFESVLASLAQEYKSNDVELSISCYPPATKYGLPVRNCANRDKLYLELNGDIYTCNYVVERFNLLGNYMESGGIVRALRSRKYRFSELFNEDGVIVNCPSISNYS